MFPSTKSIPKEMLPLADKPLIDYIFYECIFSNLKNIILVINSKKRSIKKYLKNKLEFVQEHSNLFFNNIHFKDFKIPIIKYVNQDIPKGIGNAILCAKPLVGYQPFALILPDVIINQYASNLNQENLSAMLMKFNKCRLSQILVTPISKKNISSYGIVSLKKEMESKKNIINNIIEKPEFHEINSNLSIVGRYVFSEKIWNFLENEGNIFNNSIDLTDAIKMLIKHEKVEAHFLKGKYHDCGNKLEYMKAFLEFSLKHETLGNKFNQWIKYNLK
ncbi:MAG: sugar phosphate nucleotidyltransferase [Arsenophonus sp.]|nr:MAG: sugar phosphate nucleotidyltransferase [Arsenophonus sp.]